MKSDNFIKKSVRIFAIMLFWLAVWVILAWIVNKELLLPYPHTVLITLGKLGLDPTFWKYVALTLFRILLGIVLGTVFGTALAILTCRIPFVHRLFYPLITVIRATPVASFIILALIWLGAGKLPVFICFLMVLPIVWAAVSDGIRAMDKKLSEVCRVYRFSLGQRMRYFYVPSVLPYFLSACKTSIGMAWKAGVAAEVLAVTPNSIGKQLYNAKLYLETPQLFAWTAVIVLLSLAIEKAATLLLKRLERRNSRAED